MDHFRRIDISDMPAAPPVTEPAPELVMVEIDQLVIDDRYQRPLQAGNRLAIKRIAAEFPWPRFWPVIVAPIDRGRYAWSTASIVPIPPRCAGSEASRP